ncbi:hypothetical protein [Stigmatella hybrida]|uniref:hypothetical protein n=1 Tax=Stigmatella hybrida TaxID=394097 RepID=UPI001CDAC7EB|nr:hypothetical protein [Stigmatella hybrida]
MRHRARAGAVQRGPPGPSWSCPARAHRAELELTDSHATGPSDSAPVALAADSSSSGVADSASPSLADSPNSDAADSPSSGAADGASSARC